MAARVLGGRVSLKQAIALRKPKQWMYRMVLEAGRNLVVIPGSNMAVLCGGYSMKLVAGTGFIFTTGRNRGEETFPLV